MEKTNNLGIMLSSFFLFLFLGCNNTIHVDSQTDCVSGTIVGEKCNVFALQLDRKNILDTQEWEKKTFINNGGEINERVISKYENVIGLFDLPDEYKKEGMQLYVRVRRASQEEDDSRLACYLDMPNPPAPRYFVLAVDSLQCPKPLD